MWSAVALVVVQWRALIKNCRRDLHKHARGNRQLECRVMAAGTKLEPNLVASD